MPTPITITAGDVTIPKLGLGTWLIGDKDAPKAVREAVRRGYRLIDTAEAYMNEDVLVEAYAPIAHGRVLADKAIAAIAERYDVTVAQLCIRYCLQLGCVALPKTGNPAHMAENAAVDFQISDADMQALRNVKPIKGYGLKLSFMPVFSGK